jgi:sulfatase modifying factor 1
MSRALVLALLVAACGGGSQAMTSDAGAADAGIADAGVPDATAFDAGRCTGAEDPRPQPNLGLHEAPGAGGCPSGMLQIAATPAFCIDRYEAALVDADGAPLSPYYNPGTSAARAVSIAGAVPQAYLSQTQAASACAAAGKRLCTDAEWLRACQGPGGTTYPYGTERQPGACNDVRAVHPAVEYFGSSDPSVFTMIDHPCLDQLPDTVDHAGANVGCVSSEGASDLMGNLQEWTADPAGTLRGGDFVDTALNGNGCLYTTTAHDAAHWDFSTGFRCCF